MMIHLNELVLTKAIIAFLAAATTFTATQGLLYGQQAAPEDPLKASNPQHTGFRIPPAPAILHVT